MTEDVPEPQGLEYWTGDVFLLPFLLGKPMSQPLHITSIFPKSTSNQMLQTFFFQYFLTVFFHFHYQHQFRSLLLPFHVKLCYEKSEISLTDLARDAAGDHNMAALPVNEMRQHSFSERYLR